jgi:antitoxin MazE
MHVTVTRWGNSASVRIPAASTEAAHLKLDETVDIREEGGRIVIEPIRPMGYDLAELLAGIAPANLHTEVDFGAPAGKEAKRKVSTAELNDVRAKIVVLVGPETQQ